MPSSLGWENPTGRLTWKLIVCEPWGILTGEICLEGAQKNKCSLTQVRGAGVFSLGMGERECGNLKTCYVKNNFPREMLMVSWFLFQGDRGCSWPLTSPSPSITFNWSHFPGSLAAGYGPGTKFQWKGYKLKCHEAASRNSLAHFSHLLLWTHVSTLHLRTRSQGRGCGAFEGARSYRALDQGWQPFFCLGPFG